MRLKYILPVLFLLAFIQTTEAQLGSTHYFPPLHAADAGAVEDHYIYLSTPFGDATNPVTVTIQNGTGGPVINPNTGVPYGPIQISNGNPSPAILIGNNQTGSVMFVEEVDLHRPLNNKGLRLEGTDLFYVSFRARDAVHAGYMTGKGEDALGTTFRLGSLPQPSDANFSGRNFVASFMATEDNTEVNVSDYDLNVNFRNTGNLLGTINLNAGETYVLSGYIDDGAGNFDGFVGALVQSNLPIIVNTGNYLGSFGGGFNSGQRDIQIDQIVDISKVGSEYITVKGNGDNDFEVPMVVATEDDTEIYINGSATPFATINAGEYQLINGSNYGPNNNMYITTQNRITGAESPVYLYQFLAGRMGSFAVSGMNFIPPLSCFFQNEVNLISAFNEIGGTAYNTSRAIILAQPGDVVTINAVAQPPGQAVPGTLEWVTYSVAGLTGDVLVASDGPIAVGLFGANGTGPTGAGANSAFAGYYSGFAVNPEDTATEVCTLGGPIDLVDRIDGNPAGTGTFTPPLSSGGNIFDPMLDPPGVYVYEELGVCANIIVDITVTFVDSPVIDPIADVTVCSADNYMLPDPATIVGTDLTDPRYFDDTQASGTANQIDWTTATFTTPGTQTIYVYDVTTADPDDCTAEISYDITINASPVATTNDAEVCQGDTAEPITVTATTGTPEDYSIDYDAVAEAQGFVDVATPAMPVTLTAADYVIPATAAPGIYNGVLTYIDAVGCSGTDPFTITIFANPVATVNNPEVCEGTTSETLTLTATTGAPDSYFIDYDLMAEGQGFMDAGTAMAPLPLAGAMFTIPAAAAPDTYLGTITYIDSNGCLGTDDFSILINENPIATVNDVIVCEGTTSENITVTATTGTPISYTIDYDAAAETEGFTDAGTIMAPLPITGATYTIPAAPMPGTYNGIFTYIDANGCLGTDAFTIIVNDNPEATVNNPEVCAGETSEVLTLTATTGTPIDYFIDYDPTAEAQGFTDVGNAMTPVTLTGAMFAIPIAAADGVYNGTLTYIDANGCSGTDAFTVTVFENPIATTNDVEVCEGTTTENIVVTATTGTPINYSIDYDAAAEFQGFTDVATPTMPITLTGATYAIPAMAAPATYNGTLTYVDANGCSGTDAFTIIINENPIATTNDISVCEGTTMENIVINVTTGTPINYAINYDAVAEAQGFVDVATVAAPVPITGASYAIPAMGAVGTYNGTLTYIDANGCLGSDPFTITIDTQPTATMPADPLEVCDNDDDGDDTNGFAEFDLTTFDTEILNGQSLANVSISYHTSQAFADAGTPEITSPYINTTVNQETIFVRVENDANTDCFATTTFDIIVNPLPVVTDVTLEQCDDDTDGFADFNLQEANVLISTDAANETFTYYETEMNAIDGMSPIMMDTSYANQVAVNDVVWARIETASGCIRTARVDLLVSTSQIPDTFELTYEVCDNDDDGDATNGFANFDFSNATPQIIALFPPADQPNLVVTYYTSLGDANAEIDAIMDISDFDNTVANQQLITVRVDNVVNNSCAGLQENAIVLNVIGAPDANLMVEDYDLCDEDNDLTEDFDLTSLETEILDGLNPADYSVIFYEDAMNAEDEMSPIMNSTMYPFTPASTPASLTLFARVTNESTPDRCFVVVPFDIVLNPDPTANIPADLFVCDDPTPDGFTTIDLTVKSDEIKGINTTGVTVTYHLDQMGADAGDMSIPDATQFTNTSNPQTVIARVTDDVTGCFDTVPLRIEVLQSPAVVAPTPYELCDLDNDGVATFMLSTKNDEIFAGDPTLTIAYYLTQAEAEADPANPANALDQSAYTNATPFSETVWARVENAAGCVTVVPVDLIVLDTPMPNDTPADYALCDFDQDGQEVFDLPSRNMDVLGGLDPVGYSVTWYADLTNAQNGTPDIPDATNYASTGGDVYAVVRDETQSATTFCEAIVTLTLVVEPIPVPVQPVAYELCDDEASGSTTDDTSIFDLTTREPIIIDGNTDWDVTWYTTEVGADTADPAALIPNPTMYSYTNMMVNVPVWARVADTSTQNSCHATVSLTLVVQPNPSPSAIPDVEECDGNDGILDGQATFDLTDEAIAIANGEMVVITFHETEQNAIDNMDAINEMAYTSGTRTLWARSTEDDPATATECFTIVAINLIVRDTPEITATMADLELTACDDADGTMDGTATFDLTVNDALIYGTLNPADYDLTYHESQVSAEADLGDPDYNIDIIATPAAYTFGPPATGTVWVRLQDTTQPNTLCAAVTSFTINVGATPVYTVPEPEYFACDSLDSGDDMDGIATFDLTLITADITASNPDLTVAYYASPADIPLGNDIQPQDAYQGTGADPQTITIVITSTQAGMCEVIESTDLRVNPVPQLISDPLPEAIACDPDNDDFSDFDLDAYALLIVNGQTGIDILFYETLAAAENGDPADAIVNTASYDNIVPNQVLYALATDTNNATACAKIFPFTLLSHPTPLVTPGTVDDLTDCDDDGDGQEVFDLTVQDNPLLAIQTPANDPAAFTVSYHNTQASADDITDPGVPDAANYPVTVVGSPETIFVRVRFNDGSDCFSTTSFDVIVDPLPVIGAYTNDLEVCDDDIDQIAVFDLTTNEDEITVDPLLQVDYYETMADITAGTPIVDPTMFTNTTNPQTIFVVVTSQAGCTVQTQRELRVLPLPSPDEPNPEDVVVCDDDFDGFFDFDLTPTVNEIDPASAPTIIRIFETFAQAESYDAITNTPAPATDAAAGYLYTNTVPNGQTLYARVDHDPAIVMGNTCAVIVEFDVIINPLPVVNPDRTDPYVFCEQEDGDDSMGDLILENIASEIALLQAPQVEGDFFISYHEDQSQAQTDDFALNSPYTFDENVFTGLWIRIENRVTGCFVVEFLAIVVEARPVAQQPEDLMVCEDIVPDDVNGIPTPGTATIDLTVQDEIIFGGPLGPTDQVNYFTSLADANLNMNAIVDPVNFINTSDPQTIWAVVEDTTTSCPSSPPVSFAIDVKEVPYTDLSDTGGEICVDPLTGEVLNPIVLDGTPETLVAGALYTYEWRLDGTLVSIDPTVTVTQVGTYEVTVTATYTDPITAMVHQCTYVADTFFTPVSAPLFQVEVVEDAFNPGGLYTVEVIAESITGFGVSEYEFAIDDGPFQDGLVFTNVRPGTHTVFGRRVDGNCSETPVEIGIIDYPRFFTPNADGFHDTWNILGIGTAPNLNAKIYIFDRYGKLLKQLSPTSPGWNGTFNGQPMPSNDYWFRVEYNEIDDEGELVNKEFSGHFALKR